MATNVAAPSQRRDGVDNISERSDVTSALTRFVVRPFHRWIFVPLQFASGITWHAVRAVIAVTLPIILYPMQLVGRYLYAHEPIQFDDIPQLTYDHMFSSEFERKYGRAHPPALQVVTYAAAISHAKRELKFLLIYLHSTTTRCDADVDQFCTEVLSSDEMMQLILERDILFWPVTTACREGYKLHHHLRVRRFPFMVLIVQQNEHMIVAARLESGHLTQSIQSGNDATSTPTLASQVCSRIVMAMNESEAYLVSAIADREERRLNQSIREEQDAAFAETLRIDRERQAEKRRREEMSRACQAEAERQRQCEKERRSLIALLRSEYSQLITKEPNQSDTASGDIVHVKLKLPSGQRIGRRFLSTDNVSNLARFVFCHPEGLDNFQIVTNFPKRVLPCRLPHQPMTVDERDADETGDDITLAEFGLSGSVLLFVNDLES